MLRGEGQGTRGREVVALIIKGTIRDIFLLHITLCQFYNRLSVIVFQINHIGISLKSDFESQSDCIQKIHIGYVMTPPKVFVSYSHDSQEHKKWVLEFATRLRSNGIDAMLDQWDLKPGGDLPFFMEQGLNTAERVLMVCTEKYVQKANQGAGGVGYEKMIVTADLLKTIDSEKVIPIIRQSGTRDVPTFLKSKLFLDFSLPDQFEFSFDELIRALHKAPLYEKPPIANNPFTPVSTITPNRTGDGVLELMKQIVPLYERNTMDYVEYERLIMQSPSSRILIDVYIDEAISLGLLTQDNDGDVRITVQGKHYAVINKLVS